MSSSRARARARRAPRARPDRRAARARPRSSRPRRRVGRRALRRTPDRLAEPADVVDDRRHAGAERLQEGAGLVELRAIREDRDRRLARARGRAPPAAGSRAATRPAPARAGVERHRRVAGDDQPGVGRAAASPRSRREPLVGRITPSASSVRPSSPASRCSGRRDVESRAPRPRARRASRGRVRCGRRPVEPREQAPPEIALARCASAAGRAR